MLRMCMKDMYADMYRITATSDQEYDQNLLTVSLLPFIHFLFYTYIVFP